GRRSTQQKIARKQNRRTRFGRGHQAFTTLLPLFPYAQFRQMEDILGPRTPPRATAGARPPYHTEFSVIVTTRSRGVSVSGMVLAASGHWLAGGESAGLGHDIAADHLAPGFLQSASDRTGAAAGNWPAIQPRHRNYARGSAAKEHFISRGHVVGGQVAVREWNAQPSRQLLDHRDGHARQDSLARRRE